MFRIRRIYDEILPINQDTLKQVKAILRSRFSEVSAAEIEEIGNRLRNPFKKRFRTVLFVAENARHRVLGFAVLLHEPLIGFCFLDWIATAGGKASGGIGGALYERIRQESHALGVGGLFCECLPDDETACPDRELLSENRARLRFYERYGARPVIGTAYETPIKAGDSCFPYLVYDGLGRHEAPERAFARRVVRAILKRKYADLCPPGYIRKVLDSFRDDPVKLRNFRYARPGRAKKGVDQPLQEPIALVVNDRHSIHHVHERGYVESPVRIRSILSGLEKSGLFQTLPTVEFPEKHITAVHDRDFAHYIRRACRETPPGKSLYPYVFPIRNKARPPRERSVLSGYYCIDTFTPINRNAYAAARRAVDCSLTAARQLLGGRRLAYALVRPPGHHAERRTFGGFCYFNNAAIAAEYLSKHGKAAILDIDYHHGNGQQDIFYRRSDVLTLSIHGHPEFAYPYFSGFQEESGEGEGEGYNLNLPLPENIEGQKYRRTLAEAIGRIEQYAPDFLVVALGVDTAKGDPTGTWSLTAGDFEKNGHMIGELKLPTVVIQEGGYRSRSLGANVRHFLTGLSAGTAAQRPAENHRRRRLQEITIRRDLTAADPGRIRDLVRATGFFNAAEVQVAGELAEEYLAAGPESGYLFLMAERAGRLAGYICFGKVPMTVATFDLYWIAVSPEFQGQGLGRSLLRDTEVIAREMGGTRIYVDTSLRSQYAVTRSFYEKNGYRLESVLEDFYAPGDGKAIYSKKLSGGRASRNPVLKK
jgi:acetoin utilization deacetylase AcuC-like enzyme/ribosomal protein S18 acetylase RimI-like enzyme